MEKLLVRTLAFSLKDANELFAIDDEAEIKQYLLKLNSVTEIERFLSMIFNVIKSDMSSTSVLTWLNLFVKIKTVAILSSPVIQNILRQIVIYHKTMEKSSQFINESLFKMKRLYCVSQNKQMNEIEEEDEDEDLKLFVDDSDFEFSGEDSDTVTGLNGESSSEMDEKDVDQSDSDNEVNGGEFSDEMESDEDEEDDDDEEEAMSMDSEEMDGF